MGSDNMMEDIYTEIEELDECGDLESRLDAAFAAIDENKVSRRFKCSQFGDKCRSSLADRGNRTLCRYCETKNNN